MGRHRAPHVAFNVVIPRVICAKGLFARLQDFVDLVGVEHLRTARDDDGRIGHRAQHLVGALALDAHLGKLGGQADLGNEGLERVDAGRCERLGLLAPSRGLNTCWVALTYRKKESVARVAAGERFVCCIALGHGESSGTAHKAKPVERLGRMDGDPGLAGAPAWFIAGLEAAQLSPTALNQQRFRFDLAAEERTVRARTLPAVSCGRIDLGIAKLHFELRANTVSHDWKFA